MQCVVSEKKWFSRWQKSLRNIKAAYCL